MQLAQHRLPILNPNSRVTPREKRKDCARCHQDFGMLHHAHMCHQCGYWYCSACCNNTAILQTFRRVKAYGYEQFDVCVFCNENLYITGADKEELLGMTMERKVKYMGAYNIPWTRTLDNEGLALSIIFARTDHNVFLSAEREEFYRNESVPEGEKPTRYCYLPYLTLPPPDIQLPLPEPIDLKGQGQKSPHDQQLHPNSGPSSSFAAPAPPPYTPQAGANDELPSFASSSTYSGIPNQDPTDIETLLRLSPEELSNLSIGTIQAALLRNKAGGDNKSNKQELTQRLRQLLRTERQKRFQANREERVRQYIELRDRANPTDLHVLNARGNAGHVGTLAEREDMLRAKKELLDQMRAGREERTVEERLKMLRTRGELFNQMEKVREERAAEGEAGGSGGSVGMGGFPGGRGRMGMGMGRGMGRGMGMRGRGRGEFRGMGGGRGRGRGGWRGGGGWEDNQFVSEQARMLEQFNNLRMAGSEHESSAAGAGPGSYYPQAQDEHVEFPEPHHPDTQSDNSSGQCVICEDGPAVMAAVDCGHMSMCPDCSHNVMQTSKECPLCRAPITSESKLLRIYKA